MEYQNNIKNKLHIRFGKFAKLTGDIEETYYAKGKYLIKYNDKNIIVEKNSKNNRVKREGLLLVRLLKDRKFKLILYRTMYYVCKIFMKKDIWLILDREETANDNGEVFYNYILKNKNKDIKSFFVINSGNKYYKKIKRKGKVIKFNSIKHKLYFLLANKIISSQANKYVINIFNEDEVYMKNLYNFDFIFLQHGIIGTDLSKWLSTYNKNIKIFVTSTSNDI